jgi:hypothetical protein
MVDTSVHLCLTVDRASRADRHAPMGSDPTMGTTAEASETRQRVRVVAHTRGLRRLIPSG